MNDEAYEFLRSLDCAFQVTTIDSRAMCNIETSYGHLLIPMFEIDDHIDAINQVYTKAREVFDKPVCLCVLEKDGSSNIGFGALEGGCGKGPLGCVYTGAANEQVVTIDLRSRPSEDESKRIDAVLENVYVKGNK